jgi:uncharacterized protein (DUF1778 family)
MSKGMGTPRGRDVFADLERAQDVIAKAPPATETAQPAPAGEAVKLTQQESERFEAAIESPPAPNDALQTAMQQHRGAQLDMQAIRALRPRKEPTVQTNARMPVSLLDDIDDLCRLFGLTKTDIMVDGTRCEVARLKKQFGLE